MQLADAQELVISIHASLAGGDQGLRRLIVIGGISIHASLAGGDRGAALRHCSGHRISIHASLAGGDVACDRRDSRRR